MATDTRPHAFPQEAAAQTRAAEDNDPLWYKDAIIYQAHVKSFFDSSNDGVGDFPGLTAKLDYLQELGIGCLWILPFFPSPLRDDGYDISDYRNVHPAYGTLENFRQLVHAAHERRIRVLIELVVNHTSDQHPWFQRARHAPPGSPEREFYVWSDTDRKFPETRIIFVDSEKSNWTYDPAAKQYYWHRFFSHQPDLNHNNPAVVEAVIDVMKFWFDVGVDAMRLDAVPYLCVREGTSNENLPETHQVLKRMRRELDAAYPHRMLLAEANQWPSDVRPYFGSGDECHMAFHFPLMPRMFMALKQEDRHPITEILNQTPEIPETCQWALFLRNHDELTLEMVTDEERDYMYEAYAADPQMRLNVGIRRRLAPLMENSRRRVELLNMLLFSLPGTPIIYYGDEIGMGDNIYLGDRNGVRTPMQWSGDRNGGFSRADPARLYAPPIMDPVYGFQAINVEAQERFPFSLLNWMKRLIAMRKHHSVLGRGSLEIVYPSNRKVLCFLRRDAQETILVVANLSRSVQPVELDLSAFAGLAPIEMWGLTEFPRITDRPYFLSLGPYAAHWFTLQREAPPMTQTAPRPQPLDPNMALAESLPSLLVGSDWETLLDAGTRNILERQALAPFLARQRWFGSKARTIAQARFADWTMIRPGATPAFLAMISVVYADQWSETYLVPLAFAASDEARRVLQERPACVLARVTGARKGVLMDGLLDDDVWSRLLVQVDAGADTRTGGGRLRGLPAPDRPDLPTSLRWVRAGSDQSNSVAFANERYALKIFRRIEQGPNPDLEIVRFLTEREFTRIPRLGGALMYERPGLESSVLALVQAAITHQGSGWDFTIDELRRFYESASARLHKSETLPAAIEVRPRRSRAVETFASDAGPERQPPPFFAVTARWYLTAARMLGRRTAELHLALAKGTGPAFEPEPLDAAALEDLGAAMTAHATAQLNLLESKIGSLAEPVRPQAAALLASRTALLDRLGQVRHLGRGGCRIRVHGDYHLGQVLRTEEDFVILDFEGEPARSLEERRQKQSPLKDVAGMMRSFSYAAHTALFASSVNVPDDFSHLEDSADTWQYWVSDAFVTTYRSTLGDSALVPEGEAFDHLLGAFALEKALYELGYEINHRPEWILIPLTGILRMI